MPAAVPQFTLLIPGLSGPETDHPITDYIGQRPLALDSLLSRSRQERVTAAGLEATLGDYFGIGADELLPVAALCWLADTGLPAAGYLLRADPVHLRPDQSCLRLFDTHSFPLAQQEADAVVASINAFNAGQGWELHAPHPQRWYLRVSGVPDMITQPPSAVAGKDIAPFLPCGADARHWHTRMNELQMLLHDHPVNHAREQRGEPVINSLWFWGGGVLPQALRPQMHTLCADHPLARGLAQHAATEYRGTPAGVDELLAAGAGDAALVLLDSLEWPAHYNDVEDWLQRLRQLENDWFMPLLAAVQQGRIASLLIDNCAGRRFHVSRGGLRAFWKRRQPFEVSMQS